MARKYDVTPQPDGSVKVKKRAGWIWWSIYGFVLLAALLSGNPAVIALGAAFIVLTPVGLILRARQGRNGGPKAPPGG